MKKLLKKDLAKKLLKNDMLKKLLKNDLLKNDLTLKIISVLCAMLLWLIIYNEENPYKEKAVTVSLEVLNYKSLEEKGIEIKDPNYARNVDITVRARENALKKVNADDFNVYLDFSRIDNSEQEYIEIDKPLSSNKEISITKYSPSQIELDLESKISATFPVIVEAAGTPKENHVIISSLQVPEEVTLYGIESLINSVSVIKAEISLEGMDGNTKIQMPCKVYNSRGQVIDSLSKNLTVNVEYKVGKYVGVIPVIEGRPAPDHVKTGHSVFPEKVLVTGEKEDLDQISNIKTLPVSIDGMAEKKSIGIKLDLPAGVRVFKQGQDTRWVEDKEESVTVNVDIEKYVKETFYLEKSRISLVNKGSQRDYDILNSPIPVTVKGLKENIDSLEKSSIGVTANVRNLADGIHGITPDISHPISIILVEAGSVQVKIDSFVYYYIDQEDIEIINKDEALQYTIEIEKSEIILKGIKSEIEKAMADFKAAVDVWGLGPGTYSLPAEFQAPSSVEIIKQAAVKITAEEQKQEEEPEESL